MSETIIEYARKLAIEQLFCSQTVKNSWGTWKSTILNLLSTPPTPKQIYDIGDNLRDIFRTTGTSGRGQSSLSGGGTGWEALVCWYLNLCLIGRRTFVIKHSEELIPAPISSAITVNYNNIPSNTESDLIAITFPNKSEYVCDKDDIVINDENGNTVPTYIGKKVKRYNYLNVINALVARDFKDIEIHNIQCKTNWNDNAQIPMLWDAVYLATTFRNGITVGSNGYSMHDAKRFTYSFVTVPSNSLKTSNGSDRYKPTSTPVLRVIYLTGGNYWGLPTKRGVASSVKEMLERNLKSGCDASILDTIKASLPDFSTTYNYFRLL